MAMLVSGVGNSLFKGSWDHDTPSTRPEFLRGISFKTLNFNTSRDIPPWQGIQVFLHKTTPPHMGPPIKHTARD